MEDRHLWLLALGAAAAGYLTDRAARGEVRGPEAVRGLYGRLAPAYDFAAWIFQPLGARHLLTKAGDFY